MSIPLVRAIAVEAPLPSLEDNTADIDRLRRALLPHLSGVAPQIPCSRLAKLAGRFRAANFRGLAIVNDGGCGPVLVDFWRESQPLVGMALDLGSTHLEASLIDLAGGTMLARAARHNGQTRFGADILSRIHHAGKGEGLAELHRTVIEDINLLAAELAMQAGGLEARDIRALVVSGNTTMLHFFLNVSPHHLCREPYIPMVTAPDPFFAAELGLALHPAALVWPLPGVGSYFGGDLIAGVLASGLDRSERVSMLIDVGTNAEVVVGNRDWLIACAGAAGPALEGGVAQMGMQAGPGAIEHIEIDPQTRELSYSTIGGGRPQGICGSGIIDLVAGLYLSRQIDLRGKFRPEECGSRLRQIGEGFVFTVVPADEAADGRAVELLQVDLDALMRSKAAMYAILSTLVNQVGIAFEDLDRIFVAGAFGRHISPSRAIVLGMLPDLPLATYQPVGNSSLAGAERVLLDGEARARCRELARKITYIELNVNHDFMLRFSGSRFIPHTDRGLFPSVPHFDVR